MCGRWLDHATRLSIRPLDAPAYLPLKPLRARAGAGSVRPDQFKAGQGRDRCCLDPRPSAHKSVQARGMYVSQEDQARGVDQDMALAPERFLARIVAPLRPAHTCYPCSVWASTTAAKGSRARPSGLRARSRNRSCMRRSLPSFRRRVRGERTVDHGGTWRGSMRPAHPERTRWKIA
jgi:hypothetical protein